VNQPRMLDAYCGAGGATKGYQRAGFHVTGVDITSQPRYCGDEFIQGDAIEYVTKYGHGFDAIHASPPCQHYSPLTALSPHVVYPDLIAATRVALTRTGRPWVIENVMAAPLLGGVVLCGGMWGLRTYRHRRFELSPSLRIPEPPHPPHVIRTATKRRRELWNQGWHVSITGDVGVYVGPEAMGIDWMTGNELCEAIPPAYAEYVGGLLVAAVQERAA
jgi:DNA (cytosine-5)-methyltransferase 1